MNNQFVQNFTRNFKNLFNNKKILGKLINIIA